MSDQVAAHIGSRIRQCRWDSGLTQQQLALQTGVGAQQIHKYERGIGGIGAYRLWRVARALEKDISYFFVDIGSED